MAVDNELYDRPGDIWWDESQPLNAIRTSINPARLQYFARAIASFDLDPAGKVMIDIGCGGGLMAEEMACAGAAVIGIDPSQNSLATAREHAAASGLRIDYRRGSGEAVPCEDECADIVYCVDVLEHVHDLDAVISETARILKPGGLYIYDTINRTRQSKLVMIKLSQDWAATAWMPRNLHDWNMFIPPAELHAILARHGLQNQDMVGMAPGVSPPVMLRLLRQLKKQRFSPAEFGRRTTFVLTDDLNISYIGHAQKT